MARHIIIICYRRTRHTTCWRLIDSVAGHLSSVVSSSWRLINFIKLLFVSKHSGNSLFWHEKSETRLMIQKLVFNFRCSIPLLLHVFRKCLIIRHSKQYDIQTTTHYCTEPLFCDSLNVILPTALLPSGFNKSQSSLYRVIHTELPGCWGV